MSNPICPDCGSEGERLEDGTWCCELCCFEETDEEGDPYYYYANEYGVEEE